MRKPAFDGHDPDFENMSLAAAHVASKMNPSMFNLDELAMALVHKNAPKAVRAEYERQGAKLASANDGTLIQVISGARLTELGIAPRVGGLRCLIITKRSTRVVEHQIGTADDAVALGRLLIAAVSKPKGDAS